MRADDTDHAVAFDDLAILASAFHRCSDFHNALPDLILSSIKHSFPCSGCYSNILKIKVQENVTAGRSPYLQPFTSGGIDMKGSNKVLLYSKISIFQIKILSFFSFFIQQKPLPLFQDLPVNFNDCFFYRTGAVQSQTGGMEFFRKQYDKISRAQCCGLGN